MNLKETAEKIKPLDEDAIRQCKDHWDKLCKPLGSLGCLEALVIQLAGIYGTPLPRADKKAVIVMAADNGVVEEGVTQTGSEVTAQVMENMGDHKSSVCIMAKIAGAEVIPVNIGMFSEGRHPGIWNRRVKNGTENIAKGPAMTRKEAIAAIETGIQVAAELKAMGYQMLLTGEMGIGNTTSSSAMASVLLQKEIEEVTGRGAGLSSEGLNRKISVIKRAIEINRPDRLDAIDVLSKVGGLDIAGMIGCYLGAAYHRVPILIDGFISSVAAYAAVMICPACRPFMVPTHCSAEPAGQMLLDALSMHAPIHAEMRLGEGTGAVTALGLYDYAFCAYYELPSFADNQIEEYKPQI